MWMRTYAICLVSSISRVESCCLPLVNAGICELACCKPTDLAMSNLLSAKTTSSGKNLLKSPRWSVKYLSLTQLQNSWTQMTLLLEISKQSIISYQKMLENRLALFYEEFHGLALILNYTPSDGRVFKTCSKVAFAILALGKPVNLCLVHKAFLVKSKPS